jgi:hypothetical protein
MIEVVTKLIKTITMLKNILKLEGAQKLTKNEQKSINGGITEWMAANCVSESSLGGACQEPDETYWYRVSGWCCNAKPTSRY